MEEARVDFLDQLGWGFEKLEEMGIVSPVSAIQCRYKFSAVFPEIVMINVQLQEFKGVKMKLSYEMKKEDGTLGGMSPEIRGENIVLVADGAKLLCLLHHLKGGLVVVLENVGKDYNRLSVLRLHVVGKHQRLFVKLGENVYGSAVHKKISELGGKIVEQRENKSKGKYGSGKEQRRRP